MYFGMALDDLKAGKTVRRFEWRDGLYVEYDKNKDLLEMFYEKQVRVFHPTTQDMFAADWIVINGAPA